MTRDAPWLLTTASGFILVWAAALAVAAGVAAGASRLRKAGAR